MKPMKRLRVGARSVYHHVFHRDLFNDDLYRDNMEALRNRVEGKRVALVGNAASIFERSDGAEIDACDIVMRMNRGFVRDVRSQGSRTDVLCISTALDWRDLRAAFGDAAIVYGNKNRWVMTKLMWRNRYSLVYYPLDSWAKLSARLDGKVPSTGLMAIDLLRKHLKASEIRLYGFDWKQTKTYYSDKVELTGHAWDTERRIVEEWAEDGSIVMPPNGNEETSFRIRPPAEEAKRDARVAAEPARASVLDAVTPSRSVQGGLRA